MEFAYQLSFTITILASYLREIKKYLTFAYSLYDKGSYILGPPPHGTKMNVQYCSFKILNILYTVKSLPFLDTLIDVLF